jgi:uncharacterized protein (TIGR03435 family)
MKREQQTNNPDDVLANVGDSLREWTPSGDEEQGALDRVWNGLRWKASHLRDVPRVSEVPRVPKVPWVPGVRVAAAAALVIVAVGAAMVWPRGVRVYAAGSDGLEVTLADDSRVEMRARAEMAVARASDGIQIDLKTGDIIVTAAKQRDGHLSVRTKDMTVAVNGTAFLASAGEQGSRVGVIEGEARVREGNVETRLLPGEQVATSLTIGRRPLAAEDITWSRNADVHRAKVDSFMKGVAQTTAQLTPLRQADVTAGQTAGANAAAPEFEEASIRPCDPDNPPAGVPGGRGGGGSNAVYMTPGRFYALCMTPATLIRTAYGYFSVDQEVEMGSLNFPGRPENRGKMFGLEGNSVATFISEDGRRVRGGPDWVRTEKYTIEAVAGGLDPKKDECVPLSIGGRTLPAIPNGPCKSANAVTMSGPMLVALLERRFGLKAHIVTEQAQAFSLVVAPGGLKMKEGACTTDTPRQRGMDEETLARWFSDLVRRNLNAARRGDATTGLCGLGLADNGPNRIFVGAGAGLPPFERILGAPVANRTGIPDTKRFNYALEFLVEQTRNPFYAIATPLLQIADNPSSVQPAPNLSTALEQQLGLRLVSESVPRDHIIIDAIRRPGPN